MTEVRRKKCGGSVNVERLELAEADADPENRVVPPREVCMTGKKEK